MNKKHVKITGRKKRIMGLGLRQIDISAKRKVIETKINEFSQT